MDNALSGLWQEDAPHAVLQFGSMVRKCDIEKDCTM